jgi:hypothetical protein
VSELDQFYTATNARHARADESKPGVGQTVKVEAPILILGALDHEGGIVPLDRPQLPESGVPLDGMPSPCSGRVDREFL